MHPSSKRVAAQSTGESPPSQRTRRNFLPPSLLRQPPRREYNAVQPGFTLEELEEIEDDPEAAAEAEEEAEEEAAYWRTRY